MSWEKLTQDITFYAFYVASKQGKTGLTVTVDVWEHTRTGTATEVVSGGSAVEIGDGLYKYVLSAASVDAIGEYLAVFKTADSTVDAQHIPAVWIVGRSGVENHDAATSTRLAAASYSAAPSAATVADAVWDEALSGHATAGTAGAALSAAGGAADPLLNPVPGSYASGTAGYVLGQINPANVVITSPVTVDGTEITIVRGDDYANADGRALTFTGATWPTLTSGSVALRVSLPAGVTSYTGTITGAQACRVELASAQTALLAPGEYRYDLEATLAVSSRVVTLVQGTLIVLGDVR